MQEGRDCTRGRLRSSDLRYVFLWVVPVDCALSGLCCRGEVVSGLRTQELGVISRSGRNLMVPRAAVTGRFNLDCCGLRTRTSVPHFDPLSNLLRYATFRISIHPPFTPCHGASHGSSIRPNSPGPGPTLAPRCTLRLRVHTPAPSMSAFRNYACILRHTTDYACILRHTTELACTRRHGYTLWRRLLSATKRLHSASTLRLYRRQFGFSTLNGVWAARAALIFSGA